MMPLRLQYSITSADLAESQRRWILHPGMIALAFAGFGILLLGSQALHPEIPLRNPPPIKGTPVSDVLIPLLVWGLILVAIWLWVFRVLRRMTVQPWEIPPQRRAAPSAASFWICLIVSLSVIIVGIALTVVAKRRAADALGARVDPDYSPAFETVLSMTPFLFLSGVVPFLIRRTNSIPRLWSRQYQLHRPFVADIDESSIRISEPLAAFTYTWSYFRGQNQSPNLYLLYPSPLTTVMIPKRAFPTPEARRQFEDFLARTVVAPTTAFPVSALPLPALPVAALPTASPEAMVSDQG